MRAERVMARGALQFPYTSGPDPEKSNTALPWGRGERHKGGTTSPRSPNTHFGGVLGVLGGLHHPGPSAHLAGVHLHPQPDGRPVVHEVLSFHRCPPACGEALQHLPHGHLGVGLGTAGVTERLGMWGGPGGVLWGWGGPTWMWAMYAWTTGRP